MIIDFSWPFCALILRVYHNRLLIEILKDKFVKKIMIMSCS
ncbi:MAG: hypothetical protein PWQ96_2000, partial [Clostridia bacterium]|nr:hypothetical protein [Clostridia bacterium]